jgi:MerR family transcriptional regulator, mercuric resistance operon regulatory protein
VTGVTALDLYRGTDSRVDVMDGLTIGGLAQRAGVNVETVRYYERRGLLIQPNQTGRRRYTEQSVNRLALIRRAKHLGFTLAEIGELLDAASGPTAEDILNAAHTKLKQVEAGLRELQALRCRLFHLVRACAVGEHGCVTLLAAAPDASAGQPPTSAEGPYRR